VALADQYARRHLGFINPAIYQIGRGAQYHRAFHDVTKGNNTVSPGPSPSAPGAAGKAVFCRRSGW